MVPPASFEARGSFKGCFLDWLSALEVGGASITVPGEMVRG